MPNWSEGVLKIRGTKEQIENFIRNGIAYEDYKFNLGTDKQGNRGLIETSVPRDCPIEIGEDEITVKNTIDLYIKDTRRMFINSKDIYTYYRNSKEENKFIIYIDVRQATGKAVIKEIDEWLAKTGEEEARQAGAMPNDYGCKHLDDPNWKKWWCGDCGDYCKRCGFLEQLGYKNYHRIMNAKDYGIPQNRNRCFMVSILGDYYYTFPTTRKLKYLLKDFLDRHVDEKYYLSDATIEMFEKHTAEQQAKGNGFKFEPTTGGGMLKQSAPEPVEERTTILLSSNGTKLERTTTVAATICARDRKGFGNQAMNAVVETRGGAASE